MIPNDVKHKLRAAEALRERYCRCAAVSDFTIWAQMVNAAVIIAACAIMPEAVHAKSVLLATLPLAAGFAVREAARYEANKAWRKGRMIMEEVGRELADIATDVVEDDQVVPTAPSDQGGSPSSGS